MSSSKVTRTAVAFALLVGLVASAVPACSGSNQEGPLVTCEDLQCGRINACAEGIIAQCADGLTVRYHACSSDATLCEADWQIPGQYRCVAAATDCEGCRPESLGCDAEPVGGAGGTGGTNAAGGSGG